MKLDRGTNPEFKFYSVTALDSDMIERAWNEPGKEVFWLGEVDVKLRDWFTDTRYYFILKEIVT